MLLLNISINLQSPTSKSTVKHRGSEKLLLKCSRHVERNLVIFKNDYFRIICNYLTAITSVLSKLLKLGQGFLALT